MLDLVDEPDLLDRLSALDDGLADTDARPYVAPPPLADRLLIPEGEGRWRSNWDPSPSAMPSVELQIVHEFDGLDAGLLDSSATADSVFSASRARADRRRTHHLVFPCAAKPRAARKRFPGALVAQVALVMLCTAAGAAGAAYVFHDRLAVAMERVEASVFSLRF